MRTIVGRMAGPTYCRASEVAKQVVVAVIPRPVMVGCFGVSRAVQRR
jgi:hypothetical protein